MLDLKHTKNRTCVSTGWAALANVVQVVPWGFECLARTQKTVPHQVRIKKKRKNMQVVFMDECRDGQGETQGQWLTVASFDAYDDHGVG